MDLGFMKAVLSANLANPISKGLAHVPGLSWSFLLLFFIYLYCIYNIILENSNVKIINLHPINNHQKSYYYYSELL